MVTLHRLYHPKMDGEPAAIPERPLACVRTVVEAPIGEVRGLPIRIRKTSEASLMDALVRGDVRRNDVLDVGSCAELRERIWYEAGTIAFGARVRAVVSISVRGPDDFSVGKPFDLRLHRRDSRVSEHVESRWVYDPRWGSWRRHTVVLPKRHRARLIRIFDPTVDPIPQELPLEVLEAIHCTVFGELGAIWDVQIIPLRSVTNPGGSLQEAFEEGDVCPGDVLDIGGCEAFSRLRSGAKRVLAHSGFDAVVSVMVLSHRNFRIGQPFDLGHYRNDLFGIALPTEAEAARLSWRMPGE